MQKLDDVLIKQLEKNNVKYFWDVFNYLVLASFDEVDAIVMANDYCNGDIWDGIIGAEITLIELPKKQSIESNGYSFVNMTGGTLTINTGNVIAPHLNDYHIPIVATHGYIGTNRSTKYKQY